MIYTYSHPHTTFKRIDTAPIEARLLLIHSLVMRLLAMGLTKRLLPLAQKMRRLARVLARASAHNNHMENKLAMLRSPLWRERVLRDLGGMARLKLWDAAMLRARGVLPSTRQNTLPAKPEPVWWRSPERIAESERLKARFRLCMDAALQPRIFRDPYKMDFDGQFRLAPIPRRGAIGSHLPPLYASRIYSRVDICEYNYDAIPVQKPKDFGPAMVWPLEFYAAITLEVEGDTRGLNAVVAMVREARVAELNVKDSTVNVKDSTALVGPKSHTILQSKMHQLRDDIEDSIIPDYVSDYVPDFVPDFLPLPIFLGTKIHDALFRVPP